MTQRTQITLDREQHREARAKATALGISLAATVRALAQRLARVQAECRLPSVTAAVVHDGALKWTGAASTATTAASACASCRTGTAM